MHSAFNGRIVIDIVDRFINYYKMNAKNPSRKRQNLLKTFVFFTEVALKGGFFMYSIAAGFYFLEPFYKFFFKHEVIPFLPIFFPFVDETTTIGYIILTLIHLTYMVCAVLGSLCTDFLFIMVIVNIPVLSNIFADEVHELNKSLEDEEEEVDILQVKGRFRNILFMHREIFE